MRLNECVNRPHDVLVHEERLGCVCHLKKMSSEVFPFSLVIPVVLKTSSRLAC